MPISTINRIKTISLALDNLSGNNIVPIYQNTELSVGEELLPGYKIISFNTFIKNLRAYAKIESLEEATPPNFVLGDSDTAKAYKVLDSEWKSERKQLNLFISSDTTHWFPIASVSLTKPGGYPYKIYNLQDLYTNNLAIELGDNSRIGVQIQDVGYGYLEYPDIVTIHGSYVEEIIVEHKEVLATVEVQNTIEPKESTFVINNIIPKSGSTGNTDNTGNTGGTTDNTDEDDDMADWIIKNTNYDAKNKDKILISQDTIVQITLPSNPLPGNSIAFLKRSNSEYPVIIDLGDAKYNYQSVTSLTLNTSLREVKLIFVSPEIGWIPSVDNVFTQNENASTAI